jgi:hypothetical protein
MSQKSPPGHPPTPDPEAVVGPAPPQDEPEPAAAEETEAADPYDDLWDPDMDTRPERIKRTKTRPRTDSRSRGRTPPRSKRREDT